MADDIYQFTSHELGQMFSVSVSAIQKWGVEPCGKRGRKNVYDIRDVVRYRIGHDEEAYDERRERAKLAHYQAESARLDLEQKRGNLVPSEDALKALDQFAEVVKGYVLSLPTRAAQKLANKDAKEVAKILTNECRDILTESAKAIGDTSTTAS